MRNVYIAISEGNVYRDLVRLGMLRHLLETVPDVRVILLTQAWAVREVQEEVRHERLIVARHDRFSHRPPFGRFTGIRRMQRRRFLIDLFTKVEGYAIPAPVGLRELFSKYPPSLVVSTHPLQIWEWDLVNMARKWGIPTAGVVKSWDNVLRRLHARTDRLGVWGKANYREALEVEKYRDHEVRMVGAAAFDRYFTPGVILPRDDFWRAKGLDPSKPIIFFGTAGAFSGDWDETFMLELLLEITEQSEDLKDVQIVCRLHPCSYLQYFWSYREHPRVVLSFGSYVKTLGWCMTRDEVDEMANMLCHADIVITPASTLSIEGPIFDTPTIVTLFSTVRPELHARAMDAGWLSMHFKPIVLNDWLPLARSPEELIGMIRKALHDRSWYRDGRKAIVDEYVTFTDGKSYQRVASFIDELAGRSGRLKCGRFRETITPGNRLTEMNKRLKILFLTDWYPSEENPVSGIFIKEHAKAATLYNDVTLMVIGGGTRFKKKLYDVTESMDEGIRTLRFRYKISPIPKTSYFLKIWGLLKYFRKMLQEGYRPDVIHVNTIPAGIPAIILGKLYGIPVVIMEHSTAFPMHALRPLIRIEVRIAMNRAAMLLPVSEDLMTHIQSYGIRNRFHIIPNAVNTELFYPSSVGEKKEHVKRMLFVNSLIPRKGVPYLLEALAKLRNKRKDFLFDIVGDGPDRAEYEAMADKLGLSDCVTFHGWKTKPEVAEYMRRCDIFVLPSIWENLPCVLIEAMASGARIIATDVGGVRELVNQEAGLLVPPKNIQSLEEAMNKMLDNYDNYSSEKIAKYAREKFGYEAVGCLLDAVYREILVR